jgi:hypothetical protein
MKEERETRGSFARAPEQSADDPADGCLRAFSHAPNLSASTQ